LANARSSSEPCQITALRSCRLPGRKPGVSTSTTSGTLKRSQVFTKRAALRDASASITPPRCRGWFAITPTERPSSRTNAVTMLRAQRGAASRILPPSTMRRITWRMS
jgi:hypothetical protein